jgi:hypothetical protein
MRFLVALASVVREAREWHREFFAQDPSRRRDGSEQDEASFVLSRSVPVFVLSLSVPVLCEKVAEDEQNASRVGFQTGALVH